MQCKNCHNLLQGNFCHKCGQKAILKPLSLKECINLFLGSLNFDSQIFMTLKKLISQPDKIVRDYLLGRRKRYTNPIKFYILTLTIQIFVITIAINQEDDTLDLLNSPIWIILSLFILIPVFSFFTYLLTRNYYSYIENIVVNLYFFGCINLLSMINNVIRIQLIRAELELGEIINLPIILIPVIYLTWSYYKLIKKNIILLILFQTAIYIFSLFIVFLITELFQL